MARYLLGDNTSIPNQEVPVLSPTTANVIGQLSRMLNNNLNLKASNSSNNFSLISKLLETVRLFTNSKYTEAMSDAYTFLFYTAVGFFKHVTRPCNTVVPNEVLL